MVQLFDPRKKKKLGNMKKETLTVKDWVHNKGIFRTKLITVQMHFVYHYTICLMKFKGTVALSLFIVYNFLTVLVMLV